MIDHVTLLKSKVELIAMLIIRTTSIQGKNKVIGFFKKVSQFKNLLR
jgi:hypothetical protein